MGKFIEKFKNFKPKISITYLIFTIIIFFGCLYQITQVIDVYFQFETKVDVSFDSKSQIVIPMLSFCRNTISSHRDLSDFTAEELNAY